MCRAPGAPPCKALSDSAVDHLGFMIFMSVCLALQSLGERAMSAMSATNHHYHHTVYTANTQLRKVDWRRLHGAESCRFAVETGDTGTRSSWSSW